MSRGGAVGTTITIGIRFYRNGSLIDPDTISNVRIYDQETGGSIVETLVPQKVSTGYYKVEWNVPSYLNTGVYYDQWTWIAESGMSSNTQRYSFSVTESTTETTTGDEDTFVSAVLRGMPTWTVRMGLETVEDVGNGMGMILTWNEAYPSDPDKIVHYNIYHATTRYGVFENGPRAVALNTQAVINVTPGNMHYFAVRATEFSLSEFNIEELNQIGPGVFEYPDDLTLSQDINDAYGITVYTTNNDDYPEKGFLLIDYELLKYSLKNPSNFVVTTDERGQEYTLATTHSSDSNVKLWYGVEDGNSIILTGTAAWHKDQSFGAPRDPDAIGQYNADEDGYRAIAEDVINTDHSSSELAGFASMDFCGTYRTSMEALLSGECVRSYQGGEFGGYRGLNIQERNMSRLDAMLRVDGEAVVLLRRRWTGRKCRCGASDLRREHPRKRCEWCYGTSFEGGYNRFVNSRPISESYTNDQGKILIRVAPFVDDVIVL